MKDSGGVFLLALRLIGYADCLQLRMHQRCEANLINVRCPPEGKIKGGESKATHIQQVSVSHHSSQNRKSNALPF